MGGGGGDGTWKIWYPHDFHKKHCIKEILRKSFNLDAFDLNVSFDADQMNFMIRLNKFSE